MKNVLIAFLAITLSVSLAQAQEGKLKKKAAATEAKMAVTADKADLKMNKAERKADKLAGDKDALKTDRKAHLKKEGNLVKDQAKKDVKVAKEKL